MFYLYKLKIVGVHVKAGVDEWSDDEIQLEKRTVSTNFFYLTS